MNKTAKIGLLFALFLAAIVSVGIVIAPPPPTIANVEITSPIENQEFDVGSIFDMDVDVTCTKRKCTNTVVTITLSAGLFLLNNDPSHSLGDIREGRLVTTIWSVSADSAGSNTITVDSTNTQNHNQPDSDSVSISVGVAAPTQCDDGIDNDGDGHVDLSDSRCFSPLGDDESPRDFCNDTDGTNIFVQGFISGEDLSVPFNFADGCLDSVTVLEYFCGTQFNDYNPLLFNTSCVTNSTSVCSNGACI